MKENIEKVMHLHRFNREDLYKFSKDWLHLFTFNPSSQSHGLLALDSTTLYIYSLTSTARPICRSIFFYHIHSENDDCSVCRHTLNQRGDVEEGQID
jgi:hypothetical protein